MSHSTVRAARVSLPHKSTCCWAHMVEAASAYAHLQVCIVHLKLLTYVVDIFGRLARLALCAGQAPPCRQQARGSRPAALHMSMPMCASLSMPRTSVMAQRVPCPAGTLRGSDPSLPPASSWHSSHAPASKQLSRLYRLHLEHDTSGAILLF